MQNLKLFSTAILLFTWTAFAMGNEKCAETESAQNETIELCAPETFANLECSLTDGGVRDDVFQLTDDGILKINGKKFGYLATKESYKNGIVRGEYALEDAKTNAGFLVRITEPSKTFLPRCVEIQVMPKESGDLFGFHGLKISGTPSRFESDVNHEFAGDYSWVHAMRNVENPIGEWNRLEILFFEDFVLVKINDSIVNWAFGVENVAGRVAFQSEGGPVRWRNVSLTEVK